MSKRVMECLACGHRSFQWVGRCPGCGAWDSFVEVKGSTQNGRPVPVPISQVDIAGHVSLSTGIDEFDRVLGRGLIKGSVVLLAGEPGVGKSTLMLQAAAGLEKAGRTVSIFCGEESLDQVAARARRLGGPCDARVSDETNVSEIAPLLAGTDVAVVDSVQTLFDPDNAGAAGSVAQVRGCAARLAAAAKSAGTALIVVGHVTKEGSVAGPRALEHLVDVVLHFEGDRTHTLRTLRGLKNRFAPTGELGVFEMQASGLKQVADASGLFLAEHTAETPGSVVGCTVEGRRPLALELQALVVKREGGLPRRVGQGIEASRLAVLLAVLEKHAGFPAGDLDVYTSVAGGIRASDPGIDLALSLAITGSGAGLAIARDMAAVGEVSLGGRIRPVGGQQQRMSELARLGFKKIAAPPGSPTAGDFQLVAVDSVADALSLLLEQSQALQPAAAAGG